ncbi:MAG: helix-turn-helix domain-containing protein [Candidatus Heimdallarchaeota archaeon]|nr:MAG: helix-turn-helix domain-containing protein [Candidatus Heimdallarchaeota archaeon]
MLYNFKLEIQHLDGHANSFSKFSNRHPNIEVQLWCNTQHDIIELIPRGLGEKKVKEILEKAIIDLEEELGSVVKIYPEKFRVQLLFKFCRCAEFPLDAVFSKYDCLELPPTKYFAGKEILNLIVTPSDTEMILEDIKGTVPAAKVNVLKLAPLKSGDQPYPFYLPIDDLSKMLSERQHQALLLAFKNGYYDTPRPKGLTESLANEMSIGRRTFDEHLHKAEKKIMNFLVPAILSF